ncbi:MOS1T transposase, partial [Pseudoatta argentina]
MSIFNLLQILLHYFIQKKSAAEAHRILVETYGDNALSDTTCRDWFRRFKNNDFELEDKERSGAPKKFQDKELEQLLDETGDRYRLQLMRLSRALKEKRPLYAQRHDKDVALLGVPMLVAATLFRLGRSMILTAKWKIHAEVKRQLYIWSAVDRF